MLDHVARGAEVKAALDQVNGFPLALEEKDRRPVAIGPDAKRMRELVLPILNVGPGVDSPSAATSFSRPSTVCVTPRIVTGPSRTFISIERPAPDLP